MDRTHIPQIHWLRSITFPADMTTLITHPRDKFGELYRDMAETIDAASSDLSLLEISHEDGRQKQKELLAGLEAVRQRFRDDLQLLEKHAEWDKLTVAFFGETNAGKSTIIESLRILLEEEGRQAELASAANDLQVYEQRLREQTTRLTQAIDAVEQDQRRVQDEFRQVQTDQQSQFKQQLQDALSHFEGKQQTQVRELLGQIRGVHELVQEEASTRTRQRIRRAGTIALLVGLVIGVLGGTLGFYLLRS